MKIKIACVLMACMACAVMFAHAQSLYRCGNSFQQIPCDGEGSGAITVKEAFSSPNKKHHSSIVPPNQGLDETAFNSFYLKGMPAICMNAQQLSRVLGAPVQVSSKTIKGMAHEQHVYEKEGRRVHVQLKDGVATSLAYRQASKAHQEAARKQSAASCPTELEIRNARVAANSLTLSPKERAKRQKAIKKMEQCGQKHQARSKKKEGQ